METTNSFGKVKLVLKNTKYFLESTDPEILQKLLKDSVIAPLRVHDSEGISTVAAPKMAGLVIPGTKNAAGVRQAKDLQASDKNQGKEGANDNEPDSMASSTRKTTMMIRKPSTPSKWTIKESNWCKSAASRSDTPS